MGQEISQPRDKCNNIGRRQQQQQQKSQPNKHQYHQPNFTNQNNNDKYTKRNSSASTTTLTSSINSNSSDDELQRKQLELKLQQQRPKYNTPKQSNNSGSPTTSYEKQKLTKKLSIISNISSTSDYQSTSVSSIASTSTSSPTHSLFYDKLQQQHQRKNSQSTTDSGIYYTSCHCSNSSAASSCGSTSGSAISSSNKSLDKQKNYLNHHLYIKSYLDILEEDEKARAHFQSARPGGIRNYTPKILSDTSAVTTISSNIEPSVNSNLTNSKQLRSKSSTAATATKGKDDPWI